MHRAVLHPAIFPRTSSPRLSRRGFLVASAAGTGALVVGCCGAGAAETIPAPAPDVFVRIAPDDGVTVIVKHLDMGQGVSTGLATIVAEELDADWTKMRVEFAPANAKLYNNLHMGPMQGTGGSTSIANSWTQLRLAAAGARAMILAAAAKEWRVPAAEIAIENGRLSHASGKSGRFGQFAEAAALLPAPREVRLKDPAAFRRVGAATPRIDSLDKSNGAAVYASDIRRPDMLTAVVARPPRFGARVKSFDASEAKGVAGVVDVIAIAQGVAVLAENTWAAIKGRKALAIAWDESGAERRSSAAMLDDCRKLAAAPGLPAASRGDAEAALAECAKTVEAEFSFPYLAHAPMETLNCVIERNAQGCEIWAGSQWQTVEQATAAAILGLRPEQVAIHTLWAGGSFGRRATPNADYIAEAATILKASGGKRPIHLLWTREDDISGGRYRPMFHHSIRAGLDAEGRLSAWRQRLVGQSFVIGTALEAGMVKNGVDVLAVEGAADMPYAAPNFAVEWRNVESSVTTLWWRSVANSHTAQAVEVTMDELAHAAGRSPVEFRLELLKERPRHAAVLKLAAERGGYGETLPAGRGRGVALHASFNTIVAMVADVAVEGTAVKVDRIVAALDCGIAVNPDVIRAQIEGAVAFALGPVLRNAITLTEGRADQTNFDGYAPLRLSEMPKVEVHIVKSDAPPTGVGEPGVPPVAPAVSNAIFAATGVRLRSLPLDFSLLQKPVKS